MENVIYDVKDCAEALADEKFRLECIDLYSNHYGVWGAKANAKLVGKHVQLSDKLFRNWLANEHAHIYYARRLEKMIGYAVVLQIEVPDYGVVTWVTQLVVHQKFRNKGIAKQILLSVWGFTDHNIWGIVTANPYAIRALEKVTRRRVVPDRILKEENLLKKFAYTNISYIDEGTEFELNPSTSKVNTQFFVDHSEVPKQIEDVANSAPWLLGDIEEGWEWFAFTFQDQETIALQPEEIQKFLETSDGIVKRAYARMQLQSKEQKWMQHTEAEIDYILKNIDVISNSRAYDLGCGLGRHSIELAKRGFDVTGIDYIESHIIQAKKQARGKKTEKVKFIQGDCRNYNSEDKAGLVICLYDVVGSFADLESNVKIIRTAYDLLVPGGYFILSVMNYELTRSQAKYCFEFAKEPNRIFSLMPSRTMERTGNIFNPEYYMIDTAEHIVYRKEQFSLSEGNLPAELLVRDRRFSKDEIVRLCSEAGFSIVKSKFVNAASWEESYEENSPKAKEILLICTK